MTEGDFYNRIVKLTNDTRKTLEEEKQFGLGSTSFASNILGYYLQKVENLCDEEIEDEE